MSGDGEPQLPPKPRRFRTGYYFFCEQHRAEVAAECNNDFRA